jgi:(R,R)-butanediol dehydrogenase/meso-butanediol dehydrogenase/diacetyl reductase
MRAARFTEIGKPLDIVDVPDPTPGAGELVLRVSGCGVCGSDLHVSSERFLPGGAIMGHEFAGVVEAIGPGTHGWREGEAVCALPIFGCGTCLWCMTGDLHHCSAMKGTGFGEVHGAFAEYVRVSATEAFRLPEDMAPYEGALVEPLAIGLHAIHRGELKTGDNVLIVGAGPIGITTALWAKHAGAREIVVSEPVTHRRDLVEQFGATATIDPSKDEVMPAFERITKTVPDVIFECVGMPGLIQEIFAYAPPRCRIVIEGVCMKPDTIVPVLGLMKELSVRFTIYYNRDDYGHTIDMLRAGRIDPRPMITDVISMGELPDAFEALRTPSTQCKVIVRP